jgi:hypothetical protein
LPGEFRPSLPGERRGGRQKGTPNKADASIKEMVIKALQTVGGAQYLARQAEQNPVAFMGLIGRVLPLQLAGHDGGKLEVEFRWREDPQPVATINGIATDVDTVATDVYTAQDVDTVADDSEPLAVTFIGDC